MKTFYIVDGNGYAYRSFYAMPPLTARGMEVHAVLGFYHMVMKLLREKKPDYLALTFDHPKPTFRHKLYAGYKAQREKMPESLRAQMGLIKEFAGTGNLPAFEIEGYEADDIMAAAASLAGPGLKVVIISSDKDMMQLVNDNVSIMKFGKKGEMLVTPEKIMEDFGIQPAHVADVLALMGDASDNIPGVEGIGEKSAYKLVQEFGTIENLYDNLDRVKADKQREKLKAGEKEARLSKTLAVLKPDRELLDNIELNLKSCSTSLIDMEALNEQFISYNFRSLVTDRGLLFKDTSKIGEKKKETANNVKESAADGPAGLHMARHAGENEIKKIGAAEELVILLDRGDGGLKLVSVRAGGVNYYIHGAEFKGMDLKGKKVITNSIKELYKSCRCMPREAFDIMLAAYLLNPDRAKPHHSLVFSEYLGGFYPSYDDAAGKGARQENSKDADAEKIAEYSGANLEAAQKAGGILMDKLKEAGLEKVYTGIEAPLALVLAEMELTGLKIDAPFLDELIKKTAADVAGLEKRIYAEAGNEFNINSPKQLGELLFEKLNLPKQRKNKTGYSTDNEVLLSLESSHVIVADILRYRMLNKLKTGFLESIKEKTTVDGMLYPDYNQSVTATGRLSSSNPNIQNIPSRGDEGREIRKIFIPLAKKEILIKADYSQIELRILAHFSGDEKLTEAFMKGGDIHSLTASEVFATPVEFLTKAHRRAAKTINFGIVYGISPFGLAKQLKVSNNEARGYIDSFFATFKGVKKYQEELLEGARASGYVSTISGRKRFMEGINSSNRNIREFAERAAINAPIQGTAADIIKLAMISINEEFKKSGFGAKMILQVHDELVFSAAKREAEAVKDAVRKIMESAVKIRVPLTVTMGQGENWYECG